MAHLNGHPNPDFSIRMKLKNTFRPRSVIVVLTVFSHLMVTFGLPLPTPGRKSKDSSQPFPCQNRPCGCATSEQCWKGDCCCFTLEEKLVWADEHGVEPPEHVRPLVESRKVRPPEPKKKSCCSDSEPPALAKTSTPSCCERQNPASSPACAAEHALAEAEAKAAVAERERSRPLALHNQPTHDDPASIHWVVAIFAQKCRGEGLAGLIQLDPAIVSEPPPILPLEPDGVRLDLPHADFARSISHFPPTPPPRPL
jgi:hypothetical protein